MAKPRCLESQQDPIRLERMVNEVAAGGRTEPLFPITTVRHPESGRVVSSSRSGDLIHQSRQAGWGLALSQLTVLAVDLLHRSAQGGWGRGGGFGSAVATNLQGCRNHRCSEFGLIEVFCLADWTPRPRPAAESGDQRGWSIRNGKMEGAILSSPCGRGPRE